MFPTKMQSSVLTNVNIKIAAACFIIITKAKYKQTKTIAAIVTNTNYITSCRLLSNYIKCYS